MVASSPGGQALCTHWLLNSWSLQASGRVRQWTLASSAARCGCEKEWTQQCLPSNSCGAPLKLDESLKNDPG